MERGARLANNALGFLDRYWVDNVTLLILDNVYATERLANHSTGGEVLGAALSDRDPVPGSETAPECLVTIHGLATGASDGSMAVTVMN